LKRAEVRAPERGVYAASRLKFFLMRAKNFFGGNAFDLARFNLLNAPVNIGMN